MKTTLIVLTAFLLSGCAAEISIKTLNDIEVEYKSARRTAISINTDGTVVILTGAVITDDPAAVVEALGKVSPSK